MILELRSFLVLFSRISFRALRCQRISMHKQLVLSVMLSSLFQLIEHSVLTLPSVSRQASVSTAVLSRIAQNTVGRLIQDIKPTLYNYIVMSSDNPSRAWERSSHSFRILLMNRP